MVRTKVRVTGGLAAICAGGLLSISTTGSAGDVYFGPSVYFATPDASLHAKSDVGGQLTLGYRFTPNLGLELLSESSKFDLNDGTGTIKQRGVSGQGVYHFLLQDEPISPFVSLGGGWLHSSFRDTTSNSPLVRGGLGLNWDLPDTSLSLKADASFRHVFNNSAVPFYASQDQTDRVYTVGMQYAFGHEADRAATQSSSSPPPYVTVTPDQTSGMQQTYVHPNNCTVTNRTTCSGPPDQDGDGVPDSADKCPDTPPNAVVDADGCLLYLRKDSAG